ncbi:carbohydrate esterase family 16 protein [Hydnomerulius pinastri MD-312]|uniref:Carbohydrate esterase family 16 protein n=1 Tax=Hydnomerulius pinastri MD-312 TaxID=994086 RepID=A0A0C9WFH5_9AGAM|nr:carbohydrate esterase family 16 protein [Hydnomerulius pinastri MD-312]
MPSMKLFLFAQALLYGACAEAAVFPRQGSNETVVHLAVHPQCGPLWGNVSDVNAGLDLAQIKTIVSFGDSYTDGGRHDGGPLSPAVVIPPSPFAGGRSTNGKLWVENIADGIGAKLMDYAWSSAVTNITLWPDNPYPRDFIMQTTLFLNQSNNLDPETTLYTVFFGIKSAPCISLIDDSLAYDWLPGLVDGDHLPEAAESLLGQMALLSQPPTNARNFLVTDVYGRGTQNAWGQAWLQSIFDGLAKFHTQAPHLNVAFANFATIWDGVLGSDPGYKAFGYVSTDACSTGPTTETDCTDPDHYFYWFSGHPSRVTHRIMADYVEEVLERCWVL